MQFVITFSFLNSVEFIPKCKVFFSDFISKWIAPTPYLLHHPTFSSAILLPMAHSLSYPQTPPSFTSEFLSLCHSEDWIIHACCRRWIMWAGQDTRAHLTVMLPRSCRQHHIDAVSRSHYVAIPVLPPNPGRVSTVLTVFSSIWHHDSKKDWTWAT